MTAKPEMTLENVCFRYDGSKEAENCIDAMNDRTRKVSMSFNGTRGNYYFMANNDKQWDLSKPNELTLISPSDYLLLLSAPESQAHLLTEKDEQKERLYPYIKGLTIQIHAEYGDKKVVHGHTFSENEIDELMTNNKEVAEYLSHLTNILKY